MTELPHVVTADDEDITRARIGDRLLVKGQLAAVLYGLGGGRRSVARPTRLQVSPKPNEVPALMISFSDWTDLRLTLADEAMARTISFPLSTQVTVLVEKIDEDGSLRPLSVWDASRVPIPLMPSLLLPSVALSANSVREP